MADMVLIPLPGIGTLRLTAEEYRRALVKPAEVAPQPPPAKPAAQLLTAHQMEERTGKSAYWWMTQARERRVTAEKIGRTWMFDLEQVLASGEFTRAAVPDGDMHTAARRS